MEAPDFTALLGPELSASLAKKGYTKLTPVQEAVLAPALADRDLRISSQTGSGKTLAIGFSLRHLLSTEGKPAARVAAPRALVVTPTRELAQQVKAELSWLYAPSKVKVACVTGGASYRDEHRSLASAPEVVVGTPGRLLDHLNRGSIEPKELKAIVLDEADRMLDLGFREELDAILALLPSGHRTHLVSATFSREVTALADRAQQNPAHVQGTPLGTANADIEHVVHLVLPRERVDALVNLLLADPDAQTLIFVRTRADVANIAEELSQSGFKVGSLSGEMEQAARNRALSAFKRGDLQALVATDVAARGIDVQDISRVVQLDVPHDPDSYTHRSGRTGRAGRKGRSLVLIAPSALSRTSMLLKRCRVKFRVEPVPTAEEIRSVRQESLFQSLTAEPESDASVDEQSQALAQRIEQGGHALRALSKLIGKLRGAAGGEPRAITPIASERADKAKRGQRPERFEGAHQSAERHPRAHAAHGSDERRSHSGERGPRVHAARDSKERPFDSGERGARVRAARDSKERPFDSGERGPRVRAANAGAKTALHDEAPSRARASLEQESPVFEGRLRGGFDAPPKRQAANDAQRWQAFRVSWGESHGADARRLLAMLCRRGGIRGSDIGAIRIAGRSSVVEIAAAVAGSFERATREPDPRDPRVFIERERAQGGERVHGGARTHAAPRPHRSAPKATRSPKAATSR
jgi:ATP-dependent RNA helicase DeaD